MRVSIRQATARDLDEVAGILHEATGWLEVRGMAMWREDELLPIRIAEDVRSGLFFLAECDGEAAGTVRFQLEDKLFWPDVSQDDSAFIHRLAVRRRFAGGEISSALILWAHRAYPRTRSALSPLGLHSVTAASASTLRAYGILFSQ